MSDVHEEYRARELSALRSGERTPDVCPCEKCVDLRARLASDEPRDADVAERDDARAMLEWLRSPVMRAVLAEVAQLQSGKHWKDLPSDTPYDLAILGAAEDVVEAIRLRKEGA